MFSKVTKSAIAHASAVLLALSAAAIQTPAQASDGCFGCNVWDSGEIYSLVGKRVYVRDEAGVARRVDVRNRQVRVDFRDGTYGWYNARIVYSASKQMERDGATIVTAVGICLLFGCE